MYYHDRFKEVIVSTVKGFIFGILLSIAFLQMAEFYEIEYELPKAFYFLGFTFLFGSFISIIFYAVKSPQSWLSRIIIGAVNGLRWLAGGTILQNPFLIVIGLFVWLAALVLMVPLLIFAGFGYWYSLVYYGVRALSEKKRANGASSSLCTTLDYLAVVLGIAVAAAVAYIFWFLM